VLLMTLEFQFDRHVPIMPMNAYCITRACIQCLSESEVRTYRISLVAEVSHLRLLHFEFFPYDKCCYDYLSL